MKMERAREVRKRGRRLFQMYQARKSDDPLWKVYLDLIGDVELRNAVCNALSCEQGVLYDGEA